MLRYLSQRGVAALLVLFVLSVLAFSMVRLIPGDPATNFLAQDNPDPNALEEIRERLGLNRPYAEQYISWIGHAAVGDFGMSLTRPQAISAQLAERFPVSFQLAIMAVLISVIVAIPAGMIAATRPGGVIDGIVRGASFLSLAVPAFIVATVLILVNSLTLRLRLLGYTPFSEDPLESIRSMLTPAILLSLPVGAVIARYTRGTVMDALSQDYIRTARSKGVPISSVLFRHSLRNALIPVVTIVGVQLANLIGGTVIIETIFAIPGIGSYLIESINMTDYPAIQACVLVIGLTYIVINLVVDLLYPVIDPRIRTAA